MLSRESVEILNKYASESDKLYSDGGLLYKYQYGHRCAHFELNDVSVGEIEDDSEWLSVIELFFESSINTPYPEKASYSIKKSIESLMSSLNNDFDGYKGPRILIDTCDYSKTLNNIYTKDNDFHNLELFWSID